MGREADTSLNEKEEGGEGTDLFAGPRLKGPGRRESEGKRRRKVGHWSGHALGHAEKPTQAGLGFPFFFFLLGSCTWSISFAFAETPTN